MTVNRGGFLILVFTVITHTSVATSVVPECSSCDAITCPAIPDDCKYDLSLDVCGCCYVCAEDQEKRCLLMPDEEGTRWSCQWVNSLSTSPESKHSISPLAQKQNEIYVDNNVLGYKKISENTDKLHNPEQVYFLKAYGFKNIMSDDKHDKHIPASHETAFEAEKDEHISLVNLQTNKKLAKRGKLKDGAPNIPDIMMIGGDSIYFGRPDYEHEAILPNLRYVRYSETEKVETRDLSDMLSNAASGLIPELMKTTGGIVASTPFHLRTNGAVNAQNFGDGHIGKRDIDDLIKSESSFHVKNLRKVAKGVLAYVPMKMEEEEEYAGRLPSRDMFKSRNKYPFIDLAMLHEQSSVNPNYDLRDKSPEMVLLLCNKHMLQKTSFIKSKCQELIKSVNNLDGFINQDVRYKRTDTRKIFECIMAEINALQVDNFTFPTKFSRGESKYDDRLVVDDYRTLQPRSRQSRNYADSVLLKMNRPRTNRESLSRKEKQYYGNEMDRRHNFGRENEYRLVEKRSHFGTPVAKRRTWSQLYIPEFRSYDPKYDANREYQKQIYELYQKNRDQALSEITSPPPGDVIYGTNGASNSAPLPGDATYGTNDASNMAPPLGDAVSGTNDASNSVPPSGDAMSESNDGLSGAVDALNGGIVQEEEKPKGFIGNIKGVLNRIMMFPIQFGGQRLINIGAAIANMMMKNRSGFEDDDGNGDGTSEIIPNTRNSRKTYAEFPFMREVVSNGALVRFTRQTKSTDEFMIGLQKVIHQGSSLVEKLSETVSSSSIKKVIEATGLPANDLIVAVAKGVFDLSVELAKTWSDSKFLKESPTWANLFAGAMDSAKIGFEKVSEVLPEIYVKMNSFAGERAVATRSAVTDLDGTNHSNDLEDIDLNNIPSMSNLVREMANSYLNQPEVLKEFQKSLKEFLSSLTRMTSPIARKTLVFGIKFSGLPAAEILAAIADDTLTFVYDLSNFVLGHKFIKKDSIVDNLFDLILDVSVPVIQKALDVNECAAVVVKRIFTESKTSGHKPVNLPTDAASAEKSKVFLTKLYKFITDFAKAVEDLTGEQAIISVTSAIAKTELHFRKEITEVTQVVMGTINEIVVELMTSSIMTEPQSWENTRKFLETTSETLAFGALEIGSSVLIDVLSYLKTTKDPSVNLKVTTTCQSNLIPEGLALEIISKSVDTLQGISVHGFPTILHGILLPAVKEVMNVLNSKAISALPYAIRLSPMSGGKFIADALTEILKTAKDIANYVLKSDFLSNPPSWENLVKLIKNVTDIIILINRYIGETVYTVTDPQLLIDFIQQSGTPKLKSLISNLLSMIKQDYSEEALKSIQGHLIHVSKDFLSVTSEKTISEVSKAVENSGVPFGEIFSEVTIWIMQILNKLSLTASTSKFFTEKPSVENFGILVAELLRLGIMSGFTLTDEVIQTIVSLLSEPVVTRVLEDVDPAVKEIEVRSGVTAQLPEEDPAKEYAELLKTSLAMVSKVFQFAVSDGIALVEKIFCSFIGEC